MVSIQRQDAKAVFQAELEAMGDHGRLVVSATGDFLPKPADASHIMIQAEVAAIRVRIDDNRATITEGFVLSHSAVIAEPIIWTLPISGTGVSVFSPAGGSIVQYQWLG